jgi:ATP-dependent Zn protease
MKREDEFDANSVPLTAQFPTCHTTGLSPVEMLVAMQNRELRHIENAAKLEAELATFRDRENAAKAAATAADQRRVEGPQTKQQALAQYDAIHDQGARAAYRRQHWAILGLERPAI